MLVHDRTFLMGATYQRNLSEMVKLGCLKVESIEHRITNTSSVIR